MEAKVLPYMAKLSSGKTLAVVHKTGKLSWCIRPYPPYTIHSKQFKWKTYYAIG